MPRRSSTSNWIEGLFPDGSPWSGVASAVAQGLHQATAPQRWMIDQLVQYMGHLQRSMMPILLQPLDEECSAHRCRQPAILYCLSCGEPFCLAHLHINHQAEGVCTECVDSLLSEEQQAERNREPAPRQRLDPEVRKALKVLGLKSGATTREIDLRFRKLAAENHPDHAKNERERQRKQKRMSQVTAAYHLLKRHYAKEAA